MFCIVKQNEWSSDVIHCKITHIVKEMGKETVILNDYSKNKYNWWKKTGHVCLVSNMPSICQNYKICQNYQISVLIIGTLTFLVFLTERE